MHQIAFSSIKTAAIPIRPSLVPESPMFSFTTVLIHSTADWTCLPRWGPSMRDHSPLPRLFPLLPSTPTMPSSAVLWDGASSAPWWFAAPLRFCPSPTRGAKLVIVARDAVVSRGHGAGVSVCTGGIVVAAQ